MFIDNAQDRRAPPSSSPFHARVSRWLRPSYVALGTISGRPRSGSLGMEVANSGQLVVVNTDTLAVTVGLSLLSVYFFIW